MRNIQQLNTLVKLDRNYNKKDRREGALIRGVVRFIRPLVYRPLRIA